MYLTMIIMANFEKVNHDYWGPSQPETTRNGIEVLISGLIPPPKKKLEKNYDIICIVCNNVQNGNFQSPDILK